MLAELVSKHTQMTSPFFLRFFESSNFENKATNERVEL